MPQIDILHVSVDIEDPEKVSKVVIDQPRQGDKFDLLNFMFSGWIVSGSSPAKKITISHKGMVIKQVPVDKNRPGVRKRYPEIPENQMVGFQTGVSVLGLPDECVLTLEAEFEDETRTSIGSIHLKNHPVKLSYQPKLQPLLVTFQGRSGSTWMMRLLAEHPEIAVHLSHPYETMAAHYWMHMVKVLGSPADNLNSARRGLQRDILQIGHQPFNGPPIINLPDVRDWFGSDYVTDIAALAMRSTDELYVKLAKSLGRKKTKFFLEKSRNTHISWIFRSLYGGVKEILLVRDFRDMIASMMAFNKKRGFVGVGPLDAKDDIDFVRLMRPRVQDHLNVLKDRPDQVILVKYEDLVLAPEKTLTRITEFAGIDSRQRTIARMIEDAPREYRHKTLAGRGVVKMIHQFSRRISKEMDERLVQHQTSKDPKQSIGRWKDDLPEQVQGACREYLDDLLIEAGYEPTV